MCADRSVIGCCFYFLHTQRVRENTDGILQGEVQPDARYYPTVYAGLFPQADPNSMGIAAVSAEQGASMNQMDLYDRIIRLNISDRVRAIGIPQDPEEEQMMTAICLKHRLPISLLLFGTYDERPENAATLLYSIPGLSPERALQYFQAKARDRLTRLQ